VTATDGAADAGPSASTITTDVLVVGGGPAGAAAAYWLARHGHDVTILEKKTFPREKTCGDGLTPRAVKQLVDMGLGDELSRYHRYQGLRATGMGRELELEWPSHPVYPQHGYVVRRRELDGFVAANAQAAGARLLQGHEALHPLIERGFVRGAEVQRTDGSRVDVRAEFTIVADGANSRFGRALGTFRTREWPYGTAIRTYWQSPKHAEPWIESALDVKDRNGNPMPGYGWIFPVGDGTVNIGVGLLSTFRDFKSVNTTHLLDAYAHQIADRWEIDAPNPDGRPVSGRIPMGGSVGPKAGPTHLVIGDAAGSVNPFNGEGIDYAYETARMAADVIHEALADGDATALQGYTKLLDDEYGQYFKVARLFARIIGRPLLMRELTRVGMHSRTLMEWVLRIMANLLRPDELGPAEAAYKAAALIVRLAPSA
jgi:geranylgeranyl reductase family protein